MAIASLDIWIHKLDRMILNASSSVTMVTIIIHIINKTMI